jgi:tyrosinase
MTITLNAVVNPDSQLLGSTTFQQTIAGRKSVYDLTDAEVADLRRAFGELQGISDNRGYQYLAGIHGLPQYFCAHGDPRFLIWHRPYLVMFEQALQARVATVTLPYWDWSSERAQAQGLPKIFLDPTYPGPGGAALPNPLYKGAISFPNTWNAKETTRDPGAPSRLAQLAGMVAAARGDTDYDTFSSDIEQPHNGLHLWVGGSMAIVPTSAFDPIFWVHHCFVEKLFCDWQDANGTPISPDLDGVVLAPFSTTANDVWTYSKLGYRYVPEAVAAPPAVDALQVASPHHVATLDLTKVPADFRQAELHLLAVRHPLESAEVRVFFNVPPDAATPIQGNDAYAGSLFTFGHGGCSGDEGHCDVPDLPEDARRFVAVRARHHRTPMHYRLDVTRALHAAKAAGAASLSVHMIAIQKDDTAVAGPALDFDVLRLRVT